MKHKAILKLLILFLGFSFVLSSVAVPTSRSLMSFMDNPSVPDLLTHQGEVDHGRIEVALSEVYMEGRMDIESTDYPGTGANNHHDPKAPGVG